MPGRHPRGKPSQIGASPGRPSRSKEGGPPRRRRGPRGSAGPRRRGPGPSTIRRRCRSDPRTHRGTASGGSCRRGTCPRADMGETRAAASDRCCKGAPRPRGTCGRQDPAPPSPRAIPSAAPGRPSGSSRSASRKETQVTGWSAFPAEVRPGLRRNGRPSGNRGVVGRRVITGRVEESPKLGVGDRVAGEEEARTLRTPAFLADVERPRRDPDHLGPVDRVDPGAGPGRPTPSGPGSGRRNPSGRVRAPGARSSATSNASRSGARARRSQVAENRASGSGSSTASSAASRSAPVGSSGRGPCSWRRLLSVGVPLRAEQLVDLTEQLDTLLGVDHVEVAGEPAQVVGEHRDYPGPARRRRGSGSCEGSRGTSVAGRAGRAARRLSRCP